LLASDSQGQRTHANGLSSACRAVNKRVSAGLDLGKSLLPATELYLGRKLILMRSKAESGSIDAVFTHEAMLAVGSDIVP
jgi:hypothetical protein